ncbi:hypothetical protein E0485_05835 [Paenibacillus albiflavus]|uniref:Uncharacterized protein n=1 Tax=Paenibacillus albiflavus TaxID=2545760 RepID=A0A4R4ELP9_9BACL|nr:hypothetical protein [Paenibacillus albiflavus]TCZ79381.1 hypothetical protein E0485_05835 [Paenibacillus albiflavus]
MKIEIEIPEYSDDKGITRTWEDGYDINAKIFGNEIVIEANKEGLITLAKHLLALAQENIDSGFHFHYEDMHGLEDGSVSFVIEKK